MSRVTAGRSDLERSERAAGAGAALEHAGFPFFLNTMVKDRIAAASADISPMRQWDHLGVCQQAGKQTLPACHRHLAYAGSAESNKAVLAWGFFDLAEGGFEGKKEAHRRIREQHRADREARARKRPCNFEIRAAATVGEAE